MNRILLKDTITKKDFVLDIDEKTKEGYLTVEYDFNVLESIWFDKEQIELLKNFLNNIK